MKCSVIEFPYNARTVYTAIKKAFIESGEFRGIRCDDRTFRIEASHGLPIWGENVKIKVVASGVNSSDVEVKSSDKLLFNILKWGNNKRNVGNIIDFIRNEVYRLVPVHTQPSPIGLNDDSRQASNHSEIRIVKPHIPFRRNTK